MHLMSNELLLIKQKHNDLQLQITFNLKLVLLVKIDTTESLVEVVEKQMDGLPDVTIECSGAESSMKLALLATKPGGKVVLVGHGKCHENTLPIIGAAIKEVDVFGSFRYMNT